MATKSLTYELYEPEPVQIYIDGVDRSEKVEVTSFSLTRALTSQVDTCNLTIIRDGGAVSGGFKPELLMEVYVYEHGKRIFGGQIVEMDERLMGGRVEAFSCLCKDFSYDMDRSLVTQVYVEKRVDEIIRNIVSNFLPDGYNADNVYCETVIASAAFNYEYPTRCFQQLAELTNFDWYVDADKRIFFFEKSTKPAPFGISDTLGTSYYDSLVLKNSLNDLRNVITVRGGEYIGETFTESLVADGEEAVIKLGYRYDNISATVDGNPITIGTDNLHDPNLYDALYNYQEKFLRFRQATKPAASDVVEVTGNPYLPVLVRVQDSASVSQYGEFEYKIIDKSIASRQEARERAEAELTAWAGETNEGSFETSQRRLEVGQQINIQSAVRGLNQDYIISRIQTTLQPNGRQYLHRVTLITTRTFGMVEFLIGLLRQRDKDIVIQPNEVFGTLRDLDDGMELADAIGTPSENSPPYTYLGGANDFTWGFFTWS